MSEDNKSQALLCLDRAQERLEWSRESAEIGDVKYAALFAECANQWIAQAKMWINHDTYHLPNVRAPDAPTWPKPQHLCRVRGYRSANAGANHDSPRHCVEQARQRGEQGCRKRAHREDSR